jgi:hypothetical protein
MTDGSMRPPLRSMLRSLRAELQGPTTKTGLTQADPGAPASQDHIPVEQKLPVPGMLGVSFLTLAFVFLYLVLFMWPHVPLLAWGDQAIYLLDAARMAQGQMIYRDFFAFTTPGTQTVYFLLFKLFGVRAWIPDAMLIVLGLGVAWLCVVISARLMAGFSVVLPALLFLSLPFHEALDGTHHWYSTLAIMAALAVLIDQRTLPRLALAGVLCGLAACFTQSASLPVFGIAAFLVWEQRRNRGAFSSLLRQQAQLFGAFFITTITFCAYFVWKAGLANFYYCTVFFVFKFYPGDSFNTWRVYMTEIHRPHSLNDVASLAIFFFVHALLPMIYILFFVRYRWQARDRPREAWDRLMLVGLVGSFLFLSIAPSPSYLRLCAVSPPALILLAWFVGYPAKVERLALSCLWVAALGAFIVEPLARQSGWRAYLHLPTGRTAFIGAQDFEEDRWVFGRVHPREYFFGDPGMCFTLDLTPAGPVDFIRPTDYTRPEQVRDLLDALERHKVRFIMWYSGLDAPAAHDHLGPLRSYLRLRYHLAKTFPSGHQFWLRNE